MSDYSHINLDVEAVYALFKNGNVFREEDKLDENNPSPVQRGNTCARVMKSINGSYDELRNCKTGRELLTMSGIVEGDSPQLKRLENTAHGWIKTPQRGQYPMWRKWLWSGLCAVTDRSFEG